MSRIETVGLSDQGMTLDVAFGGYRMQTVVPAGVGPNGAFLVRMHQ